MTTKVCSKCKVEKDVGEFSFYRRNKDGLQTWCKECKLKYDHDRNPDKKYRRVYSSDDVKFCPKCKTEKPTVEFSKSKHRYDGLSSWCKQCVKEQSFIRYPNRTRRIKYDCKDGFKVCSNCKEEKEISNFNVRSSGVINSWCKDCIREKRKIYRENNMEKIKLLKRLSYLKNHPPKPTIEKIKKTCAYCENVFEVTQCNKDRKYCSKECYASNMYGENNPFYNKTHTPTAKQHMSEYRTGRKESIETRNKKSTANFKRYEDPKEHERTSESNKKRFADPSQREIQRRNQIKVFVENPSLRVAVSKTFKDKKQSDDHRMKRGRAIRGENNGCWKGGVTPLRIQVRCCTKMYDWIQLVLKRDDYRDWFCGLKGTGDDPVEAHHIVRFATIMERYKIKTLEEAESCAELWDINNGITLLRSSHKAYHDMWGR